MQGSHQDSCYDEMGFLFQQVLVCMVLRRQVRHDASTSLGAELRTLRTQGHCRRRLTRPAYNGTSVDLPDPNSLSYRRCAILCPRSTGALPGMEQQYQGEDQQS